MTTADGYASHKYHLSLFVSKNRQCFKFCGAELVWGHFPEARLGFPKHLLDWYEDCVSGVENKKSLLM